MEMCVFGLHMARLPLALFIVVMVPVLLVLEYYTGCKDATTILDEVADAAVAYGVGLTASAVVNRRAAPGPGRHRGAGYLPT
jgi:hypothetical protein